MGSFEVALIAAVKKRPALFDKKEDNYSNRGYVNKQWADIAKEIGVEERRARKRWTRLRDYFQKSQRQLAESTTGKIKKWYLHNYMSFLTPYLVERSTSIDVLDLSDAGSDHFDLTPLKSPSHASVASSSAAADAEPDPPQHDFDNQMLEYNRNPLKSRNEHPDSANVRKRNFPQTRKLREPNLDAQVVNGEDEDQHYCLSLVSKMKMLDPISKLRCQMDIHAVLLRYLTQTQAEPMNADEHKEERI